MNKLNKVQEALEHYANPKIQNLHNYKSLMEIDDTLRAKEALAELKEFREAEGWQPIETAPRYEVLFVIRHKEKPHVQHEVMLFKERESWEMPQEYEVLQDMTLDEPIEGDWTDYEWMPLPEGPSSNQRD